MVNLEEKVYQENLRVHDVTASSYDRLHNYLNNRVEQKWLEADLARAVSELQGCPVCLDLGCGTGNITIKLLCQGVKVIGVDISAAMLDVLERKVEDLGFMDRFVGVWNSAEGLLALDPIPYWFPEVKALFVSSVLHHLLDYQGTLSSLISFLPSLELIFITHEPGHKIGLNRPNPPQRLWNRAVRSIDVVVAKFRDKPVDRGGDYTFVDYHVYLGQGVSRQWLNSLCCAHGFGTVLFERVYNMRRSSFGSWLDNIAVPHLRNDIFPITMFTLCRKK